MMATDSSLKSRAVMLPFFWIGHWIGIDHPVCLLVEVESSTGLGLRGLARDDIFCSPKDEDGLSNGHESPGQFRHGQLCL